MIGPTVRDAIQTRFRTPTTLRTLSRRRPFVLEQIDDKGIVLLLSKKRNHTPLGWDCLEDVVAYLRRRPGWVNAGGTHAVEGEQGTLDEVLKKCITRQTSRWVVAVFCEAGIVEVDIGPALRVRLTMRFRELSSD
jgi:hypothetical protein